MHGLDVIVARNDLATRREWRAAADDLNRDKANEIGRANPDLFHLITWGIWVPTKKRS